MSKRLSAGQKLFRSNLRLVKQLWPYEVRDLQVRALQALSLRYLFSVAAGDLQCLEGRWYVTHGGLLGLAQRNGCFAIHVVPARQFCDAAAGRWVFKATVYKSPRSKGFDGYGDADPTNVSQRVRGAEMRVAETRAVNRALRKAFGIGLCSVEELGWTPRPSEPQEPTSRQVSGNGNNGHHNTQPRLRDRLCLLIRKHQLDPTLVKRYAADFCGTEALRDASRDLVESFINNLSDWATKDREGLLCKLSSYAQTEEVKS